MEWPLMSKRRYKEVKAQLDFTNTHLMEAICTARSLDRIMGGLLIELKDWQYAPAASSRIKDLRKTFQQQIDSIVKGTRWPSCRTSTPAILAQQLQQLHSKKQQVDPSQQLQDALQDNHMLLEQLATELQRNAKVEEELRRTCDSERRLRDYLDKHVEWMNEARVEDHAAAAQRLKQIRAEDEKAATQRLKQIRAEDHAAAAQRQEELVRQAVEAQQEASRLQHLTADQAAQIATLEQQAAEAQQAKVKAQREVKILAKGGATQFQQLTQAQEQVGQLSLKMGAAEQLNKQLMQENAELQEALDRLRLAECEAAEPCTPVLRISSSRSMFSCSG